MFSKADDTSQTVYHDWYLRVEYMYMLLANTSVVSSILLFISPLSDFVNIYCIDNNLDSIQVKLCSVKSVVLLYFVFLAHVLADLALKQWKSKMWKHLKCVSIKAKIDI